jgi:hypothetical protein
MPGGATLPGLSGRERAIRDGPDGKAMTRGLELLIAQTILQGFDAQYGRFLEVTSGAQQRFEQADWHAVQQAMKQRIHLYDHHVGLVVEQLRCITEGKAPTPIFAAGERAVHPPAAGLPSL